MSEIKEFFRHCPSCGRRFHIKLVSKEEVAEKKVTEYVSPEQIGTGLTYAVPKDTPLEGDAPIYVDVKEFQYTYRCTHCGHQWSEVRDKEKVSST